jgi:hypothetical protein
VLNFLEDGSLNPDRKRKGEPCGDGGHGGVGPGRRGERLFAQLARGGSLTTYRPTPQAQSVSTRASAGTAASASSGPRSRSRAAPPTSASSTRRRRRPGPTTGARACMASHAHVCVHISLLVPASHARPDHVPPMPHQGGAPLRPARAPQLPQRVRPHGCLGVHHDSIQACKPEA